MREVRYSMERNPRTNWIIGPVGGCVDFLAVENVMSAVIVRSLELMPLIEPLMKTAAREVARTGGPKAVVPFKAFLAQDLSLKGFAENLAKDDFSLVNSHTLVSLWSGVETCIEDTIVLALMNDQQTIERAGGEIKIRGEASGLLQEAQARRVSRDLERKARQNLNVLEAYDWCLGLLDVHRLPGSDLSQEMTEVNALRNCIVHRMGIADQQTVAAVLTQKLELGEHVKISRKQYESYYTALSSFIQEVLQGVIKSRHIRSKEQLEQADL
jgi:hypothetical protein